MSRIIRQHAESEHDSNIRKIEVRSFSFTKNLSEASDVVDGLSIEHLLDEQQRMQQAFSEEKIATIAKIEQQRQNAAAEIDAARQAWEQDKQILEKKAYDEGFAEGFEDATLKVQHTMSDKISEANNTALLAVENGNAYLQAQEKLILELAIRSASRIVNQQLKDEPQLYLQIIERALKEAREAEYIKIFTSVQYFDSVTNNREEFATLFPPDVQFMIFIDDDLTGAACYLETNTGRLMVTLDDQFNMLKKGLLEIIESVD